MVPIAVRFAGGKCIYVDINKDTLMASSNNILNSITNCTKAVLLQYTYGRFDLSMRKELINHLRSRNIAVIEDCCHMIKANELFTDSVISDAAFFSTQWNKPFSTGLGGMAVFNDPGLYNSAKNIRSSFSNNDDKKRSRSLSIQILLHRILVRAWTRAWIGKIYRAVQHLGWNYGTTSIEEYNDIIPSDYLLSATNIQAQIGLKQLSKWPENVLHRKKITEYYLNSLIMLGIDITSFKTDLTSPILWAIPLFVENKEEILHIAAKKGLPIDTWFDHIPVHIDPATASRYYYHPGQCPQSENLFSKEIHLPTASWVSVQMAKKTITFLKKYAKIKHT